MEIKVRNIDPVAVKKIDELARSKKLSRNEFLKIYLEKLSVLDNLNENERRFEASLSDVRKVLGYVVNEINAMKLLITHTTGISVDELKRYESDMKKKSYLEE